MSISPVRFIPHEMKTTLVRVYSYENKTLQGTLSNPYFEKDMVFENVMQFITLMEHIADSLVFPQNAMQLRQFPNGKQEKTGFGFTTSADFSEKNPLATFAVEILFRQNASWQGSVTLSEQNASASFRSLLELLMLMDGVLSETA